MTQVLKFLNVQQHLKRILRASSCLGGAIAIVFSYLHGVISSTYIEHKMTAVGDSIASLLTMILPGLYTYMHLANCGWRGKWVPNTSLLETAGLLLVGQIKLNHSFTHGIISKLCLPFSHHSIVLCQWPFHITVQWHISSIRACDSVVHTRTSCCRS